MTSYNDLQYCTASNSHHIKRYSSYEDACKHAKNEDLICKILAEAIDETKIKELRSNV